MMIKFSHVEATLVAGILEDYRIDTDRPTPGDREAESQVHRIATQIRARLESPPRPLDAPSSAPPAGAILAPHHRASHWRQPIPGIDE